MLELALLEARAVAGAVVHGRVQADDPALLTLAVVELVRLEHSPRGLATFHVARAEPRADGAFELTVPEHAPPDVEGRDCSLHYALRLLSGSDEVRAAFAVCA